MNDADRIEEGRAAWGRVRRGATFADWLKVAIALAVGREQCMALAKCNRPFGRRYNFVMGQWLRDNGFDGISGQERHMCLKVLDAREAIEAWRNGLTEQQRRRLNHPGACYWKWKRSLARTSTAPTQQPVRGNGHGKHGHGHGVQVHWPQDYVERAAEAIFEARSTDTHKLARVALEAAVRGADDLRDLLAETRTRAPAPGGRVARPADRPALPGFSEVTGGRTRCFDAP